MNIFKQCYPCYRNRMCCSPILAKVSYICIEKTCFIPLALTKILEIFRNGDVRGPLIDVCHGLADRQRRIVQSLSWRRRYRNRFGHSLWRVSAWFLSIGSTTIISLSLPVNLDVISRLRDVARIDPFYVWGRKAERSPAARVELLVSVFHHPLYVWKNVVRSSASSRIISYCPFTSS